MEKIITDNNVEIIRIRRDRTRFILIQEFKGRSIPPAIIVLNPREMLDITEFAGDIGGKE